MGVPLDRVEVKLGDSDLPCIVGFRRPVGRGEFDGRRVRGLRQAAAQDRREARLRWRCRDVRGWARPRRRPHVRIAEAAGELSVEDQMEYRRLHEASTTQRPSPRTSCEVGVHAYTGEIAHPPHAGGVRRRTHPQPADGAQPGHRRDGDGRRRGADGGTGGRQALRLLRQPRSGRLRSARACRHPAPGRGVPGRARSGRSRR